MEYVSMDLLSESGEGDETPFSNWNESIWNSSMHFPVHELHPMDYLVTDLTPVVMKTKSSTIRWMDVIWIALFSTMLTVAVLGNIAIIWIISCHRRMRSVTNYFLLNLAIADLAMASFNGAPNFVYMLRKTWVFGKMLCIVNNFTANWTVCSCVWTMTAISIDRWKAIVLPLEPRMKKTTGWLAIIGIWIGSCFLASPALMYTQLVSEKRNPAITHCIIVWADLDPGSPNPTESNFEFAYNICLLVLTYLLPMLAMGLCYGSMSWELWFTQVGEISQRQINSMIAKRKVVKMFILVVVTFAICWVVYKKWIQHLYLSFFFLAMSQSAINPVIVIGMNGRFREYISNIFFRCLPCTNNETAIPRIVHNKPATTPPLLRRYSQSCSRSKSRSGGTAEDNLPGKKFHQLNSRVPQLHQNGTRKKNMYFNNGHEVVNLNHSSTQVHEIPGNHSPRTLSTRATYC